MFRCLCEHIVVNNITYKTLTGDIGCWTCWGGGGSCRTRGQTLGFWAVLLCMFVFNSSDYDKNWKPQTGNTTHQLYRMSSKQWDRDLQLLNWLLLLLYLPEWNNRSWGRKLIKDLFDRLLCEQFIMMVLELVGTFCIDSTLGEWIPLV